VRILCLDKPSGWTSFAAVKFLRNRCQTRKAGHLGTLDPLATGVLPIFLGEATKLIPLFNQQHKSYQATILLGRQTNTWDTEGETLEEKPLEALNSEDVRSALKTFQGEIELPIPAFSARKVKGRRAYELARKGEEVPEQTQQVVVDEFCIESLEMPEVTFRLRCTSGTYIRSIAHGLGQQLGTGACLAKLRRVKVGLQFNETNSVTPERLGDDPQTWPWLDLRGLLKEHSSVQLDQVALEKIRNGMRVAITPENWENEAQPPKAFGEDASVCAWSASGENLVALGRVLWENDQDYFQPHRIFHQDHTC
jgi:tRNA pseudouridine55 synthase